MQEEDVMAQQPLYHQIAETIREQIESGQLKRGSQLPTEIELRDVHGASRNTIRDAIKRLTSQGLVETRQGQGTYVTQIIDPFVTLRSPDPENGVSSAGEESATYLSRVDEQHRKAQASPPKVEVMPCPRKIALRLRITPGDQVISRHQVRYIDEIPWLMQTSFYPWQLLTDGANKLLMAEDIKEGTVKYLAETLDLEQIGYRDWVTARGPDNTEQAFFGLTHDAAVFEVFRTGFDQHQKAMRVTVTVYPVDRNQLVFNFGEVPDLQYEQEQQSDDAA
jgi:DNA-binding GntR family transcriptional regulator